MMRWLVVFALVLAVSWLFVTAITACVSTGSSPRLYICLAAGLLLC